MKTYLRIFALLLAALLCGMMVGCSKAPTGEQAQEQEKNSPSEAASSSAASEPTSEPSDGGSSSGWISHYDRPADGVVVESVEAKDGICTVKYYNATEEVCFGGPANTIYLVLEGELTQLPVDMNFEESPWRLEPGATMEQIFNLNVFADDFADGREYRIVKVFSSETQIYEAPFTFTWPLDNITICY